MVAATYRNGKRSKESDPIAKPGDFFGYAAESDSEDDEEMSEEETARAMEAYVKRFNALQQQGGTTYRTKA